MKLLIGILILLFVLTTMSFSDTAYANQCELFFNQEAPEYIKESDYQYNRHESSFHDASSYYMEGNVRGQNENSWAEFEGQMDYNRDWDNSETF